MSRETFAAELRDFRQGAGLTRKDMAGLLGVSDFTIRSWENGKSNPQSSSLWAVLDRLSKTDASQTFRRVDVRPLRSLIEQYARSIDLSPIESVHTKLLRIERTLSGTVLKAAQTDFSFDPSTGVLRAVPFYSDLELFQSASRVYVKQILEDAADSASEISESLDGANVEQRYFRVAFQRYAAQCKQKNPNPRILERKGSLIRHVFASENIDQVVSSYLLKEISQFLDIHDELMRGLFGEALVNIREVRPDKVSDSKIFEAPAEFINAAREINRHASDRQDDGRISPGIDREVVEIVNDIGTEAQELALAVKNSNDPSIRQIRSARLKSTIFHGALLLGRLILRSGGAALSHAGSVASLVGIVEIARPGTVVSVYNMLRTVIPELPAIPPF
ncbi:helix-turn-helix domain-containing protein [Paracoccus sanguinis]|uniref:helix-turn-helix domain-containing protein n=1 Tax=Paracoccus sanguinis TaxID=1545044 RepID=UPI0009DD3241|nr:helix-turn-helix transcriptional regulator [Paracoccus sanguinis]